MQILGSSASQFYSNVSDPAWERTLPLVPPPVSRTDTTPLTERPVAQAGKPEDAQYRRSYSPPVRMMADGYAQNAVATYEATQRLEQRDDLQSFRGVDEYA